MALVDGRRAHVQVERLGCDLLQPERRPGGSIPLRAVVHLDDFHVVRRPKRACRLLDETEQHVYADAHVRRQDDRHLSCQSRHLRARLRRQTSRADDQGDLARGAHLRMTERCRGRGEVDHHVGALERRLEGARDRHADGCDPGHHAGIAPDLRRVRTLRRAGELHPFRRPHGAKHAAAHSSGGAAHHDAHDAHARPYA